MNFERIVLGDVVLVEKEKKEPAAYDTY